MAIQFIAAKDIDPNKVNLNRDAKKPADAATLGALTMLVVNNFMAQVKWEDICEVYLSGLVDDEDMALIKRAVSALVSGGIEYV